MFVVGLCRHVPCGRDTWRSAVHQRIVRVLWRVLRRFRAAHGPFLRFVWLEVDAVAAFHRVFVCACSVNDRWLGS